MLKFTAASIVAVTKLLNQSMLTGCFPVMWKRSNIVPISKSGDKASPANCRPASLFASNIEQTFGEAYCEPLVATSDGDAANLDSQWSFQRGKSTVTALLETTHNWLEILEREKEVGAVFF